MDIKQELNGIANTRLVSLIVAVVIIGLAVIVSAVITAFIGV